MFAEYPIVVGFASTGYSDYPNRIRFLKLHAKKKKKNGFDVEINFKEIEKYKI